MTVSARRQHRRGVSMVFAIIMITAICGLCSMGADYARVQLAKTELRRAADAAARAAAAALPSGITATQTAAVTFGGHNLVDGSALSIDATNDVEFGTWTSATKTFTVLTGAARSGATAVRVTARRTAANGNAIPLFFARVIGKTDCDVSAQAVALYTAAIGSGFVGVNSVGIGNTAVVNSYNANTGTPGGANLSSGGQVSSNGPITLGSSVNLYGNVLKGPSATLSTGSGFFMSGSQLTAAATLAYAATEAPTVGSGGAVSLGNNQTMTLPAGTYNYSTCNIGSGCTITATGAVTVYITGDLTVGNNFTLNAYQNKPANFRFRMVGNHAFTAGTYLDLTADIYGPGYDFNFLTNGRIEGAVIAKTITAGASAALYYDTTLSTAAASAGTIATVK